jgi:hypothetical protein
MSVSRYRTQKSNFDLFVLFLLRIQQILMNADQNPDSKVNCMIRTRNTEFASYDHSSPLTYLDQQRMWRGRRQDADRCSAPAAAVVSRPSRSTADTAAAPQLQPRPPPRPPPQPPASPASPPPQRRGCSASVAQSVQLNKFALRTLFYF